MDIRLHTDSKKASNFGTVLMALSLVPLLIMAITGDIPWVWGTVGLFVAAIILILVERSRNERSALLVGRHNAATISKKYRLDITTAEGYRLVKGLKNEEKDAEGEVVRKNDSGVRLVRKSGEWTLRNVRGGAEYDRDAVRTESQAEEQEQASALSEYAQGLYDESRTSIEVPTDELAEAVKKVREANMKQRAPLRSDED